MFWPFGFVDPAYLLFALPALLLALYAQLKVQRTYGKYAPFANAWGASGCEVARRLLDAAGLYHVAVERVPGELTDHYDPSAKALRLSDSNYASASIAALGVVAHEVGHAVQDAVAYAPMRLRQGLVPVAGFGSNLGYILFVAGLVMQATSLAVIGLGLFSSAAVFALVTLPVEFNASRRALALLDATGLVTPSELEAAKEVLDAAALTYVAGLAQAISQVLYFLHLLLAQRSHSED